MGWKRVTPLTDLPGFRDAPGAFRVIYVAQLADAVYVLRCFRKITQKTSRRILAARRCRELTKELSK